MFSKPMGPAKTVMKVINHSPAAVAAPPMCRYSSGAISAQYSHTQPCHAYPNTNMKRHIIATAAHLIALDDGTATRTVKMLRKTVIVIAPYISTERRPTLSIVK
jgi:hypothetical protein